MKTTTRIMPVLFGTAALLAGCSGAQAPSASGLPASPTGSTVLQPQDENGQGGGCENGNLSIHPCHVTFDSKNSGPTNVTVGRDGNEGAIEERDDCASSGVATITKSGDRTYTVTAGSTTGSCRAHFTDGQGEGNGDDLRVTNQL